MRHRAAVVSILLTITFNLAWAQVSRPEDRNRDTIGGLDSGFPGATGRISGVVSSIDGTPMANARVEVRDSSMQPAATPVYTRANGSFEIVGVPFGRYSIVAVDGVAESDQQIDIRSMETQVALRMPVAGGSTVADSGGATISVQQLKVPDKAQNYYEKAQQALKKNKLQEAKDFLAKALGIFPRYAQALTMRGVFALQSNHPQEAVGDLQQAIDSDNNYGMAYIAMGAALNMMSKYDDAMRTLDRALPLAPNSWQAHFELSRAMLGKRDFASSLREADTSLKLASKDYPPLHLVRAYALIGLKNYSPAATELEHFLAGNPSGPDTQAVQSTLNQLRGAMSGTATR